MSSSSEGRPFAAVAVVAVVAAAVAADDAALLLSLPSLKTGPSSSSPSWGKRPSEVEQGRRLRELDASFFPLCLWALREKEIMRKEKKLLSLLPPLPGRARG